MAGCCLPEGEWQNHAILGVDESKNRCIAWILGELNVLLQRLHGNLTLLLIDETSHSNLPSHIANSPRAHDVFLEKKDSSFSFNRKNIPSGKLT